MSGDPSPGTRWLWRATPAMMIVEVEDASRIDVVICRVIGGPRFQVGARVFPFRRLWREGRMEEVAASA